MGLQIGGGNSTESDVVPQRHPLDAPAREATNSAILWNVLNDRPSGSTTWSQDALEAAIMKLRLILNALDGRYGTFCVDA
jgi:hypothetical protein